MNIEKIKNNMGTYDFYLMKEDKILKIIFAGNLDLYFMLGNGKIIPKDENIDLYFDITKEDYEIFSLFDSLYRDIISGNVFNEGNLFLRDYSYKNYIESFQYSILVDKNLNINWVSDDGVFELEDKFTMLRVDDDVYRLIFHRNDKIMDFGFKSPFNIVVRFRNSGSRYEPFNCVFMKFFYKLQDVDPDFHQIHFEEIVYVKKLKR